MKSTQISLAVADILTPVLPPKMQCSCLHGGVNEFAWSERTGCDELSATEPGCTTTSQMI